MTAPQSTKSDSSDESGGTGSDTAAALGFDPRYLWLGIAALVFAVGTGLALYQDPRPDPFQPVQTLSPDWWRYPVERNAFKRLPAIGGTLNAVHAHKDGRRLWAVGDAGLIVHSDDGGRTWVRQTWMPASEPPSGSAIPPAEPSKLQQAIVPAGVDVYKVQDRLKTLGFYTGPVDGVAGPALQAAIWAFQQSRKLTPDGIAGPRTLKELEAAAAANKSKEQRPAPAYEQKKSENELPGVSSLIPQAHAAEGPPVQQQAQQPQLAEKLKAAAAAATAPETWTATATPDLNGIFFLLDGRTGWVVGDGTILHTSDGGASWTRQLSGTRAWFMSVIFTDARTGWAVGVRGAIFHTSDGGASWAHQVSGTTAALQSVVFPDARTGWAVGHDGTILHTGDAGASWAPQVSGTTASLRSVVFPDAHTGWAVGGDGTILHTSDAGASWAPQVSGTKTSLLSVVFADARTGWAVGGDGTILHTSDAGTSWAPQVGGTTALLASVVFPDARTGWAVGGDGTILHTGDAGASWAPQVGGTTTLLASVVFPDARTGWAVGGDGTILHTSDAGASWTPQVSGTKASLQSVVFPDARTGWAVGDDGTILHTSTAGASWVPQVSGTKASLQSVAFTDARTGWAVGADGTILHTGDAGASWAPQVSGTKAWLESLVFPDARTGWALGVSGTILHTKDAGASWAPQVSGTTVLLESLVFPDARTGWAVGGDGTILHTSDAGASWTPQVSGTKASLQSVVFPDARTGWAVGDDGTILHTSDAGASWAPQVGSTTASLLSVVFPDARTGWAVGSAGTILHTTDAGQTWLGGEQPGARPFVTYARYPAPWWYLALLAGLGSLGMALRPPQPKVRPVASVADLALSDRPLEAGDRDALGFGAIALGLSNFLRNTATEPPLTLAITGDWGSGKSSLMNLLCEDLRSRGFRPVWFNAWHQPKDTNLLAALVSTIRMQALPPLASLEGLRFRWQLAWVRTRERPLWVAAMVFLAAYLVTYFGMKPAHLTAAIEWLPKFADAFGNKDPKPGEDLLGQFKSFAFLVAVLGPLLTAWRGLKAFGVNPGTLASSAVGSLKQASAQSRFLNDYASQFEDVANALRPRTLTLFIDDLDRCPPERVREALEAVNYLVSSGRCFVVLGMARERVEACVGLAFKDVAQEMVNLARIDGEADPTPPRPAEDEARRHRRHYARDYLKKLVNIEVPVPQPDDREAKGLVGAVPDDAPTPPAEPTWRALLRAGTRFWPLAMVGSLAVLGWWSGVKTPDVAAPTLPPPVTAPGTQSMPEGGVPKPTIPVPPDPGKAKQTRTEAYVVPGQTAPLPLSPWLLPLLVLLGATAITLIRRPQVVERDSRDFRTALATWLPLVAARQNTPREVKRFVNRVRLLAMRQRAEGEAAAHLDEPMLVALGALHHVDESLLDAPPVPGTGAKVAASLVQGGHAWGHRIGKPLNDAVAAHAAVAPWPPGPDEVLRFRELVGSVRLD